MSDDARAAADALKAAIDRHLEACVAKEVEEDPDVQRTYEALREAAESYDDALFDAFDEVTPFEFSQGPIYEPAEVADERTPARVSVFQRRDFAVRSADALLAAGTELLHAEGAEASEEEVEDLTPLAALALQLDLGGLDAIVETAHEIGLHWLGGTTWLVDQDVEDDTMTSAPFAVVDESRLLHRLDEEVIG